MINKRVAMAGLAFGLLVAGCSGGDESEASNGSSGLAYVPEETTTLPPTEADEQDTSGSLNNSDAGATTALAEATETDSVTTTTVGSGLAPVTTIAGSGGGDPDGIYRGIIGGLAPDEVVVARASPPPQVGPDVMPLSGVTGSVPARPAAVVKVDNGAASAPHTGLNAADIVIEEEVEGGVTRFAAVFHSTSTIVGPVRSGRTTDVALISGLGTPLLMYSGANDITEAILRAQPTIQNRSEATSSGYWRDDQRRAPSNLYTDTAPHWASAAGGAPPAQFVYRSAGGPVPGAGSTEFTVSYGASNVRWEWNGTIWQRWQRGPAHKLVSGQQVNAANVVVIEAERVDTGMVDGAGGIVPEFPFVGTGRATVYTEGKRIEGTWTRSSLNSVATLTHAPGEPIELTPGRTWIQLIEAGSGALR